MQEISLKNVANQQLTHSNEGNSFTINLRSFGETSNDIILFATVSVNGEEAAVSQRCVRDGWLIPQPYLTKDCGNFRFVCDDEEYPYYVNFGVTCRLFYYTDSEYKAIIERNG